MRLPTMSSVASQLLRAERRDLRVALRKAGLSRARITLMTYNASPAQINRMWDNLERALASLKPPRKDT